MRLKEGFKDEVGVNTTSDKENEEGGEEGGGEKARDNWRTRDKSHERFFGRVFNGERIDGESQEVKGCCSNTEQTSQKIENCDKAHNDKQGETNVPRNKRKTNVSLNSESTLLKKKKKLQGFLITSLKVQLT